MTDRTVSARIARRGRLTGSDSKELTEKEHMQ